MKTWIFIAILLALLSGGAYFYYITTQQRIDDLISSNATLLANVQTITEANLQNLSTIEQLEQSYVEIQENFTRVQSEFQIIRSQNNELRERLSRHELGALAAARPGLVENIVNNATANALRCFELLSGSPLTESERSATSARQANSECPWLWRDQ